MFIHLDLDCFFVSAHRSVDESLNNIPAAVGGRSNLNIFDRKKAVRHISNNSGAFVSSIVTANDDKAPKDYFVDDKGKVRGIITTCSYEARAFGVKTAMTVNEALSLCPQLKMIPSNYPLYHELSTKLAALLEKEVPLIEQFSIDEFFCDVTGWIEDDEIYDFAKRLQTMIKEELNLPISIGIAKTKWIAKLSTEFAKPVGIKLVKENEVDQFISEIPISKFPGIGKGYQEKLKSYGISTLGQIKAKRELFYSWKKPGVQLYNRVCGIERESIALKKSKQSIGIGRTFDPIYKRDEIKRRINILCRYLSFLIIKANVNPQTLSLQIRYEFNLKSKNYMNTNRLFNERYLKDSMKTLFEENDIHRTHSVIQINISVSNFLENRQNSLNLFEYENDLKQSALSNQIQKLRSKFGIDIIKNASEL